MGSKKKHEGLVVFNHNGTDIMVKPSVHNILKTLTEEVQKLRPLESKLKLAEMNLATTERNLEKEKGKIKGLQKMLRETADECREIKLENAQLKMTPEKLLKGFIDAVETFSDELED
jgi:septal ring factor EnvC (AmiA/AmiB activator)